MSTSNRKLKYIAIGLFLTLFNYGVYTIFALLIINNNDFLWLSTLISTSITTLLAYLLHSKITWQGRHITKSAIYKFFLWNALAAFLINPLLTQFFSLFTGFYEWVFHICETLHLPFGYDFIQSTGAFVFTGVITMIINYLFYDKFVFGKSAPQPVKFQPSDQNPLISIIIPAYNAENYLAKCLDSILAQTYHNLEILVVDDGSTDATPQILQKYAKKDPRLTVITQKNQGQSAARNAGLKKATGEYISFIDADDTVRSDFIAKLFAALRPHHALSICGVKYNRLYNHTSKDVYIDPLPASLESLNPTSILHSLAIDGRLYPSWNKLYRAGLAKKLHFDEKLNFAEDTKFVLDYLKLAHTKKYTHIALVLDPLYIYNFGTPSSTIKTTATAWQNWQNSYQNLKTWLGPHPTPAAVFWLHTVHLRWRISYLRSRRRSRQIAKAEVHPATTQTSPPKPHRRG